MKTDPITNPEPAMPPPPDQEERRRRAEERLSGDGPKELRAQALALAVAVWPHVMNKPNADLFIVADDIAKYIKDGTHPTPVPPAPAPESGVKK